MTKTYKKESRMIWQKNSLNSHQTECDFCTTYCEVTVLSRVRPKNILNSTGFFPMYLLSWAFSVISRLEVCNSLPFAILPSLRNPHNYHSFFSLIFCRLCKFTLFSSFFACQFFSFLPSPSLSFLFPFLSPLPSFFSSPLPARFSSYFFFSSGRMILETVVLICCFLMFYNLSKWRFILIFRLLHLFNSNGIHFTWYHLMIAICCGYVRQRCVYQLP